MAPNECISALGGWEGFEVCEWRQERRGAQSWCVLRLRRDRSRAFARRLRLYLPGVLAHCRYPLNTSLLEGINNKIKVIKRMAYGFRDDDYFFLKIRAAFPGIGRRTKKKPRSVGGASGSASSFDDRVVRCQLVRSAPFGFS